MYKYGTMKMAALVIYHAIILSRINKVLGNNLHVFVPQSLDYVLLC